MHIDNSSINECFLTTSNYQTGLTLHPVVEVVEQDSRNLYAQQ